MLVELKGFKVKCGPREASQQLIQMLKEKGLLPEERSSLTHLPNPRVPEVSLTLKIAKGEQNTEP